MKNRSFLEKIGLLEYALKIGVTPKNSEYLAAMQYIYFLSTIIINVLALAFFQGLLADFGHEVKDNVVKSINSFTNHTCVFVKYIIYDFDHGVCTNLNELF